MTDRDAFHAAILAEPADDLVRLAYADWLDEQDDRVPCPECKGAGSMVWSGPGYISNHTCLTCSGSGSVLAGNAARAEFIRCQIEEDRTTCHGCRPNFPCQEGGLCRKRKHLDRSSALLAAHGRAWSGEVTDALGVDRFTGPLDLPRIGGGWFSSVRPGADDDPNRAVRWRFGRGFVEAVTVPTLAEFVGDRACPLCRGGEGADPTGLTNCPDCFGLGRVRPCPMCRDHGGTIGCACGDTRVLPALAPALARVPGIATVEIGDRVPNDHYPGNRHPRDTHPRGWHRGGNRQMDLPPEIFDLLEGGIRNSNWMDFPTASLAIQSLARAGGGLLRSL